MLVLLRRDSKPLIKLSSYMYKKLYSERALITTFVDTKHFSCYETPCCFVSHQSASWTAQISNQTQLVVNRFYILFAFYFLPFTCFVDQLSAHTHTAHTHTGTRDKVSGTQLIYFLSYSHTHTGTESDTGERKHERSICLLGRSVWWSIRLIGTLLIGWR